MNTFIVTEENRQSINDWPEWLHKAWSRPHTEVGAVYPSEFPDSDGTDLLCLCTEEGVKTIFWGETLVEDNGVITLQSF